MQAGHKVGRINDLRHHPKKPRPTGFDAPASGQTARIERLAIHILHAHCEAEVRHRLGLLGVAAKPASQQGKTLQHQGGGLNGCHD